MCGRFIVQRGEWSTAIAVNDLGRQGESYVTRWWFVGNAEKENFSFCSEFDMRDDKLILDLASLGWKIDLDSFVDIPCPVS